MRGCLTSLGERLMTLVTATVSGAGIGALIFVGFFVVDGTTGSGWDAIMNWIIASIQYLIVFAVIGAVIGFIVGIVMAIRGQKVEGIW